MKSIKGKLIAMYLGLVLVVMMVSGSFILLSFQNIEFQKAKDQMELYAEKISGARRLRRIWGKNRYWGKECCSLPPAGSNDNVVLFDIRKDRLAALREEGDAAALRIDVARHRAFAAVQEHLAAGYIEEDAH